MSCRVFLPPASALQCGRCQPPLELGTLLQWLCVQTPLWSSHDHRLEAVQDGRDVHLDTAGDCTATKSRKDRLTMTTMTGHPAMVVSPRSRRPTKHLGSRALETSSAMILLARYAIQDIAD